MEYLLKIYQNPGANEAFEWRMKSISDSWRSEKKPSTRFRVPRLQSSFRWP